MVEGDASMNLYQDAEGKTKSSLNIIQRTSLFCLPSLSPITSLTHRDQATSRSSSAARPAPRPASKRVNMLQLTHSL